MLKTSYFTSVQALLESVPLTGFSLASQIRKLREIEGTWVTFVSPDLATRSRPTYYRDGTLTITAESPVWANSVRHQQPSILRRFHEHGLTEIKELRVHVLPANDRQPPNQPSRKSASKSAQTAIQRTAAGIRDIELQAALLKLSKTIGD